MQAPKVPWFPPLTWKGFSVWMDWCLTVSVSHQQGSREDQIITSGSPPGIYLEIKNKQNIKPWLLTDIYKTKVIWIKRRELKNKQTNILNNQSNDNSMCLRLTGRHSRDFSCHYAVQSEVRQTSSHHTTRKSKVLKEKTHKWTVFFCTLRLKHCWVLLISMMAVCSRNCKLTLGAWSRYCFPLESWVSRQNLLSCRT